VPVQAMQPTGAPAPLAPPPPPAPEGLGENSSPNSKSKSKIGRSSGVVEELECHVYAGNVAMKTFLAKKWQNKSVQKGLIESFYPYYQKETGSKLFTILRVEVNGQICTDVTVPISKYADADTVLRVKLVPANEDELASQLGKQASAGSVAGGSERDSAGAPSSETGDPADEPSSSRTPYKSKTVRLPRGLSKKLEEEGIWQDREIRFDVHPSLLALRGGEQTIDSMLSVEDTKGNNGEKGSLMITNLRMIWICDRNNRINLSIGYSAILSINIRTANSRLRGATQALFVMSKFNNSRFEFVFTNVARSANVSPRLFTTVQAVYRAYDTSRLFRDLKLRGAIIKDKALILLPREQMINRVAGVWNLSSDQGNLGSFFITNVRLVWHANLAENFNVSIPYLQMKQVRVRDSKFGPALVVETSPRCGGYILGFRLDPPEQLQVIFKEVTSLHATYSKSPVFGVSYSIEDTAPPLEALTESRPADDLEIIDDEEMADGFAAYYAEGFKGADQRDIELSKELGLAIEKLPDGITAKSLWAVV